MINATDFENNEQWSKNTKNSQAKITADWVMEQDLDTWTRQMTNSDEVTDIQDAIREGDDLIWIQAKFTLAQQVAEEQNKGKEKKTLEQMVPEDFIGFRFVFEKEASERLLKRKPRDHAIDLQEGALP